MPHVSTTLCREPALVAPQTRAGYFTLLSSCECSTSIDYDLGKPCEVGDGCDLPLAISKVVACGD